jgi:NTP pyrophosphatase (non-canonical NTP hydrolase)
MSPSASYARKTLLSPESSEIPETLWNRNVLEHVPVIPCFSKSCGNAEHKGYLPLPSQDFHIPINNIFWARASIISVSSGLILYNWQSRSSWPVRKKHISDSAQIVLFPSGEPFVSSDRAPSIEDPSRRNVPERDVARFDVVLSGSYRRDIAGLRRIHEELRDLGCTVLSPTEVAPAREIDGFVYMKGEETELPQQIELKHLDAIQRSTFVWLHAPNGYVGTSASLEVGFAHAQGIPVYSTAKLSESSIQAFVHKVDSVESVIAMAKSHQLPVPTPNLLAFQRYYKRVAAERGYERESAQNCLLLMVEEIGELAHAIRNREKLARHGGHKGVNEARELADVMIYVVHMANLLGLDIAAAVRDKEMLNIEKFLRSR